jgi:hypothetical protein
MPLLLFALLRPLLLLLLLYWKSEVEVPVEILLTHLPFGAVLLLCA